MSGTDHFNDYRALFPITERFVFMNHAGMSAFSSVVAEAMAETAQFIMNHGSLAGTKLEALLKATRSEVGNLINGQASNISFIKNTTDGISMVARGLDLKRGDNIVVPECEYPSNLYSWMLLRESGVAVKFAPTKDGVFTADGLLEHTDKQTKLIAVSYAQFSNGFVAPIKELQDKAAALNIMILVDGVQAAGVIPVDVQKDGIECFVSGAHKWMLGPPGIGFMYMDPKWGELVKPTRPGWASVGGGDDMVDLSMPFVQDARRYEDGTFNYVGIAGLQAAAGLINEIGIKKIHKKVLMLASHLRKRLIEQDAVLALSEEQSVDSPIVSFKLSNTKSKEVAAQLASDRVIVKERRGFVRVSPHFYNNVFEVDVLLRSLKRIKRL